MLKKGLSPDRSLPHCARSRCSWYKAKAWHSPAERPPSQNRAQRRESQAGDLLQTERSLDDHWCLAGPLQLRAAPPISVTDHLRLLHYTLSRNSYPHPQLCSRLSTRLVQNPCQVNAAQSYILLKGNRRCRDAPALSVQLRSPFCSSGLR